MKIKLTWNDRKEIADAADEVRETVSGMSSHMRLVAEPALVDDAVERLRENGVPCSLRMFREAV
jgi:hypothetical protein